MSGYFWDYEHLYPIKMHPGNIWFVSVSGQFGRRPVQADDLNSETCSSEEVYICHCCDPVNYNLYENIIYWNCSFLTHFKDLWRFQTQPNYEAIEGKSERKCKGKERKEERIYGQQRKCI